MLEARQILKTEEREIAVGDRLRLTATTETTAGDSLKNGERGVVTAIDEKSITVEINGKEHVIDATEGLRLDYGYAATGHSAQGLGAGTVLLDRDGVDSTASARQFYTDTTRTKQDLVIYTSDRENLADTGIPSRAAHLHAPTRGFEDMPDAGADWRENCASAGGPSQSLAPLLIS